jgi:hypothetical protein
MEKVPVSQDILDLLRVQICSEERHLLGWTTARRSWPVVRTDGRGVVSHAGSALLRELAERAGLRACLSEAMDGTRIRSGAMTAVRSWSIWR